MGLAIVRGAIAGGWARADQLAVLERSAARRAVLERELTGVLVAEQPVLADAALLAVKPADAEPACRSLVAAGATPTRLVTIVAGLARDTVMEWLPGGVRVIRAMPNVAALVGASATALADDGLPPSDLEWAQELLVSIGSVARVPERLLDAVTGLSGSGPAYLCLALEAMEEGGVASGLPRADARLLARQCAIGLGRLLDVTAQTPATLRESVTSPAGTTAAGLAVLEGRAVRGAYLDAVTASAARAALLGRASAEGS